MNSVSDIGVCGMCIKNPPTFDHCSAIFRYEDSVRELISTFKFNGNFSAGKFFAKELSTQIRNYYSSRPLPDYLVPVPLHKLKLSERGFNQSLELVKTISQHTAIPLLKNFIIKTSMTAAQSTLDSASKRKKNLRNSFKLRSDYKGATVSSVALIDDVMTTQSTLNELSLTLRKGGVKRIECFCIAAAGK